MSDLDKFSELQIFSATLIGEFESLGEIGMIEGANVIMNRVKANKHWLGGDSARGVCLFPSQFSCWNDTPNNKDRQRIVSILESDKPYAPFIVATGIAGTALRGALIDRTGGAVSYINHFECDPIWARGKTPIYVHEPVWFFSLQQIEA